MTIPKGNYGCIGEDAAVRHLEQRGYRIFKRNFSNQIGEIDIIAYDGEILCFVEVKARQYDAFSSPFEFVTFAKQKKIVQVALSFINLHRLYHKQARFDVVAVTLNGDKCHTVEILQNAFEAQ